VDFRENWEMGKIWTTEELIKFWNVGVMISAPIILAGNDTMEDMRREYVHV